MFLFLSLYYFFTTMATRSRIGILLPDDSILAVYCHWDGYPEYNGVVLRKKYNTYEKVAELIDGGDMSSLESWYDDDGNELKEPRIVYNTDCTDSSDTIDNNAPQLFKTFDEFTRVDCGEEFLYVFVKDRWEAYEISRNRGYDDDGNELYGKIISVNVKNVEIPDDMPVK